MTVVTHVPVVLPRDSADYIAQWGSGMAAVHLEYGTATIPTDGTATKLVVAGTDHYVFSVDVEPDSYFRFRVGAGSTFTAYSPVFHVPAGYCTLHEVMRGIEMPDDSRHGEMQDLIRECSDEVTERCGGRSFLRSPVVGEMTLELDIRYPDRCLSLARGAELDIISVSKVELLIGGVWVETDAWHLSPDALRVGAPYTDLHLTADTFRVGRTVRLTGAFGWAAIPPVVRRATIDLVRRRWQARGSDGEPVGASAFGAPVFAGDPKSVHRLVNSSYAWRKWVG